MLYPRNFAEEINMFAPKLVKKIVIIGYRNTIFFLRIDKIKTEERVTKTLQKTINMSIFSESSLIMRSYRTCRRIWYEGFIII